MLSIVWRIQLQPGNIEPGQYLPQPRREIPSPADPRRPSPLSPATTVPTTRPGTRLTRRPTAGER